MIFMDNLSHGNAYKMTRAVSGDSDQPVQDAQADLSLRCPFDAQ